MLLPTTIKQRKLEKFLLWFRIILEQTKHAYAVKMTFKTNSINNKEYSSQLKKFCIRECFLVTVAKAAR